MHATHRALASAATLALASGAILASTASTATAQAPAPATRASQADEQRLTQAPTDMAKSAFLTAQGRIGIPVADAAERAAVDRAGLQPVTEKRGYHALLALMEDLTASDTARSAVSIGINPAAARVDVAVLDSARGSAWAEAAARRDGVSISTVTARPTAGDAPAPANAARAGAAIYGGFTAFYPGSVCTAGFNAYVGVKPVMITAGQCTIKYPTSYTLGQPLRIGSPTGTQVGTTASSLFKQDGYDIGLNNLIPTVATPLWVARLDKSSVVGVTTAVTPYAGLPVCHEGATTREKCGTVISPSVTVTIMENGTAVRLQDLASSNLPVSSYDAGGPVITSVRDTTATGVGMTSGAVGSTSYFSKLTSALAHYGATLTTPAPSYPAKDDYPYKGQDGVDPWGFYKGECTSFAAWTIKSRLGISGFSNYYKGAHFGDAHLWDDAARQVGIPVYSTPRAGDIAVRNSGTWGHVAFVTKVNSNGTFEVDEYNHETHHAYSHRTASIGESSNQFSAFIRFT